LYLYDQSTDRERRKSLNEETPETIEWTCPCCGHTETVTKPDDLIHLDKAADLVGKKINTLMTLIATGKLRGYKVKDDAYPYYFRRWVTAVSKAQLLAYYDPRNSTTGRYSRNRDLNF
jgi:hypothetical protein